MSVKGGAGRRIREEGGNVGVGVQSLLTQSCWSGLDQWELENSCDFAPMHFEKKEKKRLMGMYEGRACSTQIITQRLGEEGRKSSLPTSERRSSERSMCVGDRNRLNPELTAQSSDSEQSHCSRPPLVEVTETHQRHDGALGLVSTPEFTRHTFFGENLSLCVERPC